MNIYRLYVLLVADVWFSRLNMTPPKFATPPQGLDFPPNLKQGRLFPFTSVLFCVSSCDRGGCWRSAPMSSSTPLGATTSGGMGRCFLPHNELIRAWEHLLNDEHFPLVLVFAFLVAHVIVPFQNLCFLYKKIFHIELFPNQISLCVCFILFLFSQHSAKNPFLFLIPTLQECILLLFLAVPPPPAQHHSVTGMTSITTSRNEDS